MYHQKLRTFSNVTPVLPGKVTMVDLGDTSHVMSLQGHTARREHEVSVGSGGSVVQWFGGSEEVSTTKYRQRMRGIQWIAR